MIRKTLFKSEIELIAKYIRPRDNAMSVGDTYDKELDEIISLVDRVKQDRLVKRIADYIGVENNG